MTMDLVCPNTHTFIYVYAVPLFLRENICLVKSLTPVISKVRSLLAGNLN